MTSYDDEFAKPGDPYRDGDADHIQALLDAVGELLSKREALDQALQREVLTRKQHDHLLLLALTVVALLQCLHIFVR